MGFCSNCGKESDNGQFCEYCGLRIESSKNVANLSDTENKHYPLWLKGFIYLYVILALDSIGLSSILMEYKNSESNIFLTKNADITMNVIAILLVIIQSVIFYLLLSPNIDLLMRDNQFLYLFLPMFHYLIILSFMSIFSNNGFIFTTIGYIVFWGLVIGSISFAIRGSTIFKLVDESRLTQKEIQQRNKEKQKLAKENSLNTIEYNYLRYF